MNRNYLMLAGLRPIKEAMCRTQVGSWGFSLWAYLALVVSGGALFTARSGTVALGQYPKRRRGGVISW
jgi:hypothetical protein